MLELISPAGLEQFFRWLGSLEEPPTPEELADMAAPYQCDADPDGTQRILERHGLTF
ncbi:hypothetical protein [Geodermatophilus sp. CPCC 205506]|uniref:hypothetical protein n=1 Tax=Geodermatophilus sp. CPCC 205506 TaxID=2936596 RepID=UPI003EEA9616